jgi:hypothetical protein
MIRATPTPLIVLRQALVILIASIVPGTICAQLPSPAPTWGLVAGAHLGGASKASFGFGAARVLSRTIGIVESDSTSRADRQVFLVAEPGWKGARVSLGYGGSRTKRSAFQSESLRLSLFRHWSGDSSHLYAGIEGSAVALDDFVLGLRSGIFTRIAGASGGQRTFVTFDFPLGW